MISRGRSSRKRQDGSTREVLDSLRRLVQVLRTSSRQAEKTAGVSGAQLYVLRKLADAEGEPLSVNELAERTLTHQSSVSVVVSKLVEHGLVERSESSQDRRRWELTLTAAGKGLVRKAPQAAQDRIVRALEAMPATKRRQLSILLGELIDVIGMGRIVPEMFLETERKRKAVGNAASS